MDERDEQEIETRLRAAFQARSELVTHQKLRPGVPPNAHTAGAAQAKRRGWAFSWRAALIPLSVTAALAGGVFVGTKLPNHTNEVRAGSGGLGGPGPVQQSPAGTAPSPVSAGTQTTQPNQQSPTSLPTSPLSAPPQDATATAATFGGLSFQPADWQLTKLDDTSACLQPKGHEAVDKAATLPCGVDALWIQTDVAADAWPVSTAKDKEGWWPKAGTGSASNPGTNPGTNPSPNPNPTASTIAVQCPATKPSAKNSVKTSATLRTDAAYPLSGTTTADFREWIVTCTDGPGALPKLWQVKGPKTVAVTAVSVNARYDEALLGIVASMHPVNG